MRKPGRAGRAAAGVAAAGLAACAVLGGTAGSAGAITGPAPVTTPALSVHASTSVPGRTEVTAKTGYNSNNVKTIAKGCPGNLHVVGAGYLVKSVANGVVEVTSLIPTPASAPTSVQLRAVEVNPYPGKWEVIVKAICGDVATTVSAAKTGFNSADTKSKSASCSGSRVIGTGYLIREPMTTSPVIGSIRPDSALSTVTINANEAFPTAANWALTALAICSPDLGQTLVTATEPPPLDSNSLEAVDAMCTGTTEATGAGFETGALGNVVADTLNPAPLEAEIIASEDQPYAPDWTLKAYGICA
jgi:hypothetical protein